MTLRQDKVSELLRTLVSEFFARESSRESMITVTRVNVSRDMKRSTIYISVFPEEKEGDALAFCKRRMSDLRGFVKPKLSMKNIPYFECEIDFGEKNRQDIDRLSNAS